MADYTMPQIKSNYGSHIYPQKKNHSPQLLILITKTAKPKAIQHHQLTKNQHQANKIICNRNTIRQFADIKRLHQKIESASKNNYIR
ncbi:hypothetical protein VRK_23970 [Vibrio sp. MEBiC08052]|nr:hypothetical protein VRK_23970 [Vibrio sp. MEBiC08052]